MPGLTSLFALVVTLQVTGAQPVVPRLDLSPPTTRWHDLPVAFSSINVEADGRCWIRRTQYGIRSLVEFKRLVEAEFLQESPQIRGASLELVEPGGRVWLGREDGKDVLLFGYDGKNWCEWRKKRDQSMSFSEFEPAVFAGGMAWFPTMEGVLRYDGKEFHHQQMRATRKEEWPTGPTTTLLAVSPDGKVALAANEEGRRLWQFHNGEWSHQLLPDDFPQEYCQCAFSDSHTFWYVNTDNRLRCRRMPGAPDDENFLRQVKLLYHDDFHIREQAPKSLLAMGPTIQMSVEQQLREVTDAEVRARLQALLKHDQDPHSGTRLNDLTVFNVHWLERLPNQWLLISAEDVRRDQEELGRGFVIWSKEGPPTFIACTRVYSRYADRFGRGHRGQPRAYSVPNSVRFWISGGRGFGPSDLIDLKSSKVVDSIPWHVMGAGWESQAYLGTRYSGINAVTRRVCPTTARRSLPRRRNSRADPLLSPPMGWCGCGCGRAKAWSASMATHPAK
jgi:hypothetical protein